VFAVTILGNNSALPMYDRHPTSQVVAYNEFLFLIDCGEGTQLQMSRYKIRRNKIRHIFISHLHGDHYFGLPGLLTSYGLNNRTEALWIYCPHLLEEIINLQLKAAETVLPYPLHFVSLENEELLFDDNKIRVTCFPVRHKIPCWGFLFEEKPKPLKLNPDILREYAVPSEAYGRLKAGEDFITKAGIVVPNQKFTLPAEPELRYAYCADTAYDETIAQKVKKVNLLYHETTYLDGQRDKASLRGHSTTRQAAAIANRANAHRLLIGHFSSRYEMLDIFLEETRRDFENTELAVEGATYLVTN